MICAREAQSELAAVLGVRTTQPVVPAWADHVYSCRYAYDKAVMVLSVKELSSKTETDGYFTSLKHRLGQAQDLGESAFTTKNRSLVVRKDYKVLLVDISPDCPVGLATRRPAAGRSRSRSVQRS
jgi:hypothetical protein